MTAASSSKVSLWAERLRAQYALLWARTRARTRLRLSPGLSVPLGPQAMHSRPEGAHRSAHNVPAARAWAQSLASAGSSSVARRSNLGRARMCPPHTFCHNLSPPLTRLHCLVCMQVCAMPRSPTDAEREEETRAVLECLDTILSDRGLRPQVPRLTFKKAASTPKYLETGGDGVTHEAAIVAALSRCISSLRARHNARAPGRALIPLDCESVCRMLLRSPSGIESNDADSPTAERLLPLDDPDKFSSFFQLLVGRPCTTVRRTRATSVTAGEPPPADPAAAMAALRPPPVAEPPAPPTATRAAEELLQRVAAARAALLLLGGDELQLLGKQLSLEVLFGLVGATIGVG